MSGPIHDRGSYEDRETLKAQIGALTDELDRLRERRLLAPARHRDAGTPAGRRPVRRADHGRQQRASRRDPARGPGPDHLAEERGRPAGPASGQLRGVPGSGRGAHRRHLHLRPQDAGQRQPRRRPRGPHPRQGGDGQRGDERRRRAGVRRGRRGRAAQGGPGGRRPRAWSSGTATRRAWSGWPTGCEEQQPALRRLPADRPPGALRVRADPQAGRRGAGAGGGAGHRLLGDRRPGQPDRGDPGRRRAAVPAQGPVRRARAEGPQGHPALRPARLRQDADRQGGGQLAGQEGDRADRGGGAQLLPQHQGPRAAEQVRRRDRAAHPAGLPAGPGQGQRRHAGDRVLRRDGLAVPHPRVGGQLRRGEHHRAPAAERDRRRRGPGQRHHHRCLQPRGHDRPGDPAARPAGRQDQDRAAGRRGGPGDLQQVPDADAAAAPRGPGRVRPGPATPASRA